VCQGWLEMNWSWVAAHGPFTRVDVALFNHGVRSPRPRPGRPVAGAGGGRRSGALLGQRAARFRADFAALARTTPDFRRLADGPPWAALPVGTLAGV
jgi:hypothetical protein